VTSTLEQMVFSPLCERVLGGALCLAALANLCVLAAGAQAPRRLGWRRELEPLRAFTRKVFWVYYFFVGGTIVAFAGLTLLLHREILAGDRAAVLLAAFMGLWWGARVVVDACIYDHRDWPEGRQFVVGHVLLTTTFVLLAATYLGVVAWHAARRWLG
jgi:hypothetical protein